MNATETEPKAHELPLTSFQLTQLFWALGRARPILPVEAVLVYARSHGGDDDGMLELAARYIDRRDAEYIVLNGGDGRGFDPKQSAWPGFDNYRARLVDLGISSRKIIKAGIGRHTREESETFADVIISSGFERVVSINQTIFQPRILLGLFHELDKRNADWVKVFADSPGNVDWSKEVFGTQGQPPAPRHSWWEKELQKIQNPGKFADRFVTVDDLISLLIESSD